MSYSKDTVSQVFNEFNNKRKHNEDLRNARLKEAYAKIPELKDIDRSLSLTGLQILGASLQGKDGLEERINKIKEENKALNDKRAMLLTENGFSADYTDMKYECNECNDQGYINGIMCQCMKRALITKQLESSGVGELILSQSFENFSLDFYQGQDKEVMESLVEDLKEYTNEFPEKKSNLLCFL